MSDVLRGLLGVRGGPTVGDDLLAMGVTAVMGRAMSLGDTVVLPSHVVFTLPREELQLFASDRLRDGLTAALRREVARRTDEHVARLSRQHGENVTVIGGELRLSFVAGDVREVDARFSGAGPTPHGCVETAPARVETPRGPAGSGRAEGARPGAADDATLLDRDLRLVLCCDGHVVGTVVADDSVVVVGRDPVAGLVVPETKEKVSRRALEVTRVSRAAAEVHVVNRNGAWLGGGARSRVGPGERRTLHVGEAIDLDREASVSLALEGRPR